MSHPAYRSDIQVLRGIAVLLVVFYHLACPFLPGGFIGVDIFFVISGFLMASALHNLDRNSILSYYGRRARRILPAYFAAIFITAIVAAILVLPFEVKQYTGKIFYYIAMLPNLGFWMDNSYFEAQSFRPGLHFWSLGVELQFYLILPLIVFFHRKSRIFTVLFLILSLASCIAMTHISPKTAFYLTPFRVWEFLAGFLVAGLKPRKMPVTVPILLMAALTGTAFVKIPALEFPGFYAISPVFLSAALIYAGFARLEKGILAPVYKFLERTGEYSYSVYLVHFPVIVFLFYVPFRPHIPPEFYSLKAIIALALTALLSAMLYRGVEQIFRRRRFNLKTAGGLFLVIFIAAGFVFTTAPKLTSLRFDETERKIFSAFFDRPVYRCGKIRRITEPFRKSCALVKGAPGKPIILLAGNSYLDSIKPVLIDEARKNSITLRMIKANCAPGAFPCTVDAITQEARGTGATHILLHTSPDSMKAEDVRALVKKAEADSFRVILVEPVADWDSSVPEMLYRQRREEYKPEQKNAPGYRTDNRELFKGLYNLHSPIFHRYAVESFFCKPECIMMDNNGYPLYFDSGHLTLKGSEILRPVAQDIFQDAQRGQ